MTVAVLAALWPWLAGWLLACGLIAANPFGRTGLLMAGPGALLGWVLITIGLQVGSALSASPYLIVGWILLLVSLCAAVRLWRAERWRSEIQWQLTGDNRWSQLAWWALLLLVGCSLSLSIAEALERPLYPWDAWSAWAMKSKLWFELGRDVELLPMSEWLGSEAAFTVEAAHYPELLPTTQFWLASWVGSWHDNLIHLPLLTVVVGCLLSTYSWFRTQSSALQSIAVCYGIASLPLLLTHIALAGYADLWLACALWMAGVGVVIKLSSTDLAPIFWRVPLLAGLLAAALAKVEGSIWVLVVGVAMVQLGLSRQRRLLVVTSLVILALIWWTVGGFSVVTPLGQLTLKPGAVEIPYLGQHQLVFSNQLPAFLKGMFLESNWHLLWYLVLLVGMPLLWLRRGAELAQFSTVFGLGAGTFMFGLFFLTGAAVWAESMTASNRLLLQVSPTLIFLLAVLLLHDRLNNSE